jgi:hypothetical protein
MAPSEYDPVFEVSIDRSQIDCGYHPDLEKPVKTVIALWNMQHGMNLQKQGMRNELRL